MTAAFDHPLLALPKYGDGLGLHRVAWLMERLDIAPVAGRAIAVTGSNGKGSTARICSALMQAAGGDVGLFTSPHLLRFNERFQVNDAPASDEDLTAVMDEVAAAIDAYGRRRSDKVGAFEAQFVSALLLFQRRRVRWLVLEAGIGGRYDPVRLARAPVGAVVSLDLEHTELLGRTLVEIAYDKLDAVAPGGVAVFGESASPLREEIEAYAALKDVAVRFVDPARWRDLGVEAGRQRFDLGSGPLVSSLVGRHQINNHAVAFELCRERLGGVRAPADLEARWRAAVEGVRWPGRLERVQDDPPVWIDVGHTPDGVRAALAGFSSLHDPARAVLVCGVSANKDARGMMEALAPAFEHIVCTRAHHRGGDAQGLAALAAELNPRASLKVEADVARAVDLAVRIARAEGLAVYVAGGLFVAIEARAVLAGLDPKALRFF